MTTVIHVVQSDYQSKSNNSSFKGKPMNYTDYKPSPKALFNSMKKERENDLSRKAREVNSVLDEAISQKERAERAVARSKAKLKTYKKALKKFEKSGNIKHLSVFTNNV